ncbi:MAG: class I SAM-dependent methyltransferase [Pyrinomonadaceae bacterium]
MSANLPASPITRTHNVTVFDTINVSDIVRLYREQEQIDVSRFFIGVDEVMILECGDTGYRFYYPFTLVGDESFYQELATAKQSIGLEYDRDWSEDHEFALQTIIENERVLEVGCNTGKFLERVREKTKHVTGLEFNPEAAAVARVKELDVRNLDIAILAENEPESFDAICAFQVLEHIPNAGDFLQACLKALKPGGKLIFSVPNNEPYFQRFSKYEVLNLPPHHMGLWNLMAFERLECYFHLKLEKFAFSGRSGLAADTYVRTRNMASLTGTSGGHYNVENLWLLLFLPLALMKSTLDWARGKVNNAHLSVVFRKC